MRKPSVSFCLPLAMFLIIQAITPNVLNGQALHRHGLRHQQVGAGICWLRPSNVNDSDDRYSYATALIVGGKTQKLQVSDFGFALPLDATIRGIEVTVEKGSSILDAIIDSEVRLLKNGELVGDNLAKIGYWSDMDQPYRYGTHDVLWGETWTPEEINDPGFGISFQADLAAFLFPGAAVDRIKIAIHYSSPSTPGEMSDSTVSDHPVIVFLDEAAGQIKAVFANDIISPVVWVLYDFNGIAVIEETIDPNNPTALSIDQLEPGTYVSYIQCGIVHHSQLINIPSGL